MKTLYIIVLTLFVNVLAAQNSLQDYTVQREETYFNDQSISDSDRLFSQEYGEILPALVNYSLDPITGNQTYVFETFRNINDRNQEHILNRIKGLFPSIIGLSNQEHTLTVVFASDARHEKVEEFFQLFGFSGIKIMIEQ